jgi:hypothetical protein
LANPRECHPSEAIHVFAYLKAHDRSSLVFDRQDMPIDESRFHSGDWSNYYPDAQEAIPPNAPEPRGQSVSMSCFIDADHVSCCVTRISHTGILIYVENAPIIWYSKRQNTVESSTFGSEFIAMKTAVEQVEALRYKLWMMGIGINGPTNMFCDNKAAFKNSAFQESNIKKKHNSIAYHQTREAQAAHTVRIAWESGSTNRSNILTKLLPGYHLWELMRMILW